MKAADSGLYRWYNDHRLPEHIGGGKVTVRLHQNEADRTRKFNRIENVRLSRPRTQTSRASAGAGTTPNRSTGPWRTLVPRQGSQPGMAPSAGRDDRLAVMVNTLTMARH